MKISRFCIILTVLALTTGQVQTQTKIMRGDSKGHFNMNSDGEAFLLKELGAAIASDNGSLKVLNVMPPDQRPASYKDIDLQEEDIIMMANGKRLAGAKDLQSVYEDLTIGGELKLGIKRKEEMRLVSLKKGDPKDLPNVQMKIMHGGYDGKDATFPAVGVLMKMKGKQIVIDELLPGETAVRNAYVRAGDIIVSMNGKEFTSLKEYSEAFDEVSPGQNVTWVLRRGESEHTVTFARPKPRMMMKQEGSKK